MASSATLRDVLHTAPPTSDTERPVPRWVLRLAYAMPLLLLPSSLWRLPFAVHFEMGQQHDGAQTWSYWSSIPYVLGLSVLTEAVALLCIGLVRRWGEIAPAWIPLIGGKRVRPLAAAVPALVGGLILTVLFTSVPLGGGRELGVLGVDVSVAYDNAGWEALAMICTAPLRVWGPAVVVLAVAYYLRRRPRTEVDPAGSSPASAARVEAARTAL